MPRRPQTWIEWCDLPRRGFSLDVHAFFQRGIYIGANFRPDRLESHQPKWDPKKWFCYNNARRIVHMLDGVLTWDDALDRPRAAQMLLQCRATIRRRRRSFVKQMALALRDENQGSADALLLALKGADLYYHDLRSDEFIALRPGTAHVRKGRPHVVFSAIVS